MMRIIKHTSGLMALLAIIIFTGIGCTEDTIDQSAALDFELEKQIARYSPSGSSDFYILPRETELDKIPQDPKNPLTPDKVQLGKFLFFETGFGLDSKHNSGLGTYSCASCHIPEKGFRPDAVQGIADGGMGYADFREMNPDYTEADLDVQEARPLNLINVAFVKNTGWNGQFGGSGTNIGTENVWDERLETRRNHLGYEGLETQNIQGLRTHRMIINKFLTDQLGYTEMFDKSFPEYDSDNRYSLITGSLAISAYLRTVISTDAPFQEWLRGDASAMTLEEKKGAVLFFGKANCNRCHYNQNLGSMEYHALGVNDMDQHPESVNANNPIARRNLGRGGFTKRDEDMFKYKVPGIYNICDSEHFFHGSSATTIEELIEYKNIAVKENPRVSDDNMSPKFTSLNLTEEEKTQLIAFLARGLKDPNITRFQPDFVMSGNCIPNNDEVSQDFLNCN